MGIGDLTEKLTCTICKSKKERFEQIVYSQGDRVCLDCKRTTQPSDNAAFDRYITEGRVGNG